MGVELRGKLSEAIEVFLKISGKTELLQDLPKTKAAFAKRTTYLDALHALQGEAMGRLQEERARRKRGRRRTAS